MFANDEEFDSATALGADAFARSVQLLDETAVIKVATHVDEDVDVDLDTGEDVDLIMYRQIPA